MKPLPPALSRLRNRVPRWLVGTVVICVAIGTGLAPSWRRTAVQEVESKTLPLSETDEPIQPIEAVVGLQQSKIDLGRKLFHDSRLSHNGQLSCASCHGLQTGGADLKARSIGIDGAVGIINSPTVFNSGFNFSQFWDGRASTLEQQIDEPVQSKIEMGSTWPEVVRKLQSSPEYVAAFRQIYRDDIKSDYIKDSIAEFERSLSTPNARFDRYLRHETTALTAAERQGYKLFKSFGCTSCHQGMNIGGNMYQKLGVMAPYFTDRGQITAADQGRFNVTKNPKDLHMFKVPSLRNVELTPPYFHDAGASTLADAVRMMAKYQLGRYLTDEEVNLIVEFLKTLTGELEGTPL